MSSPEKPGTPPRSQISIEGSMIHVVSPEGKTESMKLNNLFATVAGQQHVSNGIILPDGVQTVLSMGSTTIWVHQTTPRRHRFKWIKPDSPRSHGPQAQYRDVTIALPCLIVLAVFCPRRRGNRRGRTSLSNFNGAYFRNEPLTSLDDQLCYPALPNCTPLRQTESPALSWICTEYLDRSFDREPDHNKRLRLGMKELMSCFLDTGFNNTAELQGMPSWFSRSRLVDDRVASIEAWEEASKADPLFPAEVPWLTTGLSLREVAEHILRQHHADRMTLDTAEALARFVMNHADDNATPGRPDLVENLNDPF